MENRKLSEKQLRPYVTDQLLEAAQRGIEHIGNDLVIYVDAESKSDLLVTDRSKFLDIMRSCGESVRQALNEPARVKASRNMHLTSEAVVFWLIIAEADGVRAQVMTLKNEYRLTTHFVGQA